MARGRRKGRHASPDCQPEDSSAPVDLGETQVDLGQCADPASGTERIHVDNDHKSSSHDYVPDSDEHVSELANPCIDAGAAAPGKSKERKQGAVRGKRRGRLASPNKADDSDEQDAQASAEKQDMPSKGNRRRRRGGRRDHDDASDSDQERAGNPSDDRKHGKRASESNSNGAKHSVEKLGREANCTTFVSFKTFHGKHLAGLPSGELRGKSHVIGDPEKFELTRHTDDTISLKTCHGTYVAAERNGDLRASRGVVGDQEKFELIQHAPGAVDKHTFIGTGYMCVSLKTCYGLYIAADPKGGVKANRRAASGWESFHLKVRVQAVRSKAPEDQDIEPASVDIDIPLFDACCDLEGIFNAEESYAKSHSDHVALAFARRARARKAQGLEYSFSHFREEQAYPACFSGCVATWDATNIVPVEESTLEQESGVRGRSESDFQSRHAWATILADTSGDVSTLRVKAAFGIPAASAAEADSTAVVRLRELARHIDCVAIGPIGIDLTNPPIAETVKEEHCGLSSSDIMAIFGTPPSKFWESPKAIYDAKRDPMCIRMVAAGVTQASWIETHGDRRLCEFEGACQDYAKRRLDAQLKVAEEQVKLALELGRALIVQLPPQDEAERRMVEILVAVLGEGSTHPVLLSSFRGRPKCAATLLKHMPGLMIGFSGLLTHAKLRASLGEIAFDTPLDRIVLESLGPRYPPAVPGIGDARGSFSHPVHVRIVGEELARVKGVEVNNVLQAAWSNVCRLFNLAGDASTSQGSSEAANQEIVSGQVPPSV